MSLPRKKQTARIKLRVSRRGFSILITLLGGLAVLVLCFLSIHQVPENPPVQTSSADSSPIPNRHQLAVKPTEGRGKPLSSQSKAPSIQTAVTQSAGNTQKRLAHVSSSLDKGRSGVGAATQSPYANDLVLNLSRAAQDTWATPEMVPEISRILEALVARREAVLPSIRQYLKSGEDFFVNEIVDAAEPSAYYKTIRLSLLDVVRRIGGPEAESILVEQLQFTGEPREINRLAKYLDEVAPGAHRDIAVQAARETLGGALENQLWPEDVSLLFQVLTTYGDETVVADLEDNLNHWGYYSILGLAAVPEGKGIPSLITMVKERPEMTTDTKAVQSTDVYADKSLFALQILAQVAIKDLDAHATLVEQAGLNRIPDSLWPKIGLVLAGQYQFQNEKPDDNEVLKMVSTSSTQVRARPHVIGKNGQVIYIENRYGLKKLPADEIEIRFALIDELLSVSRSIAADRALNHARSILMANKAKDTGNNHARKNREKSLQTPS
ncbi:MAG: hypothetical protein H6Q38_2800 [Chloroflexi bacterium]|nr:hypothetical protein [Chloroflexota bacterium]